ncbi:MAG TPA: S8 family serine peptidase [Mucilaginibacter sp.]|jgi:hypothetical protein
MKLSTLLLSVTFIIFTLTGCKKTVAPEVAPASVSIDPASLNLTKGFILADIRQLKAIVTNASGSSDVVWSSEDSRIATVTADGRVTAVGGGETNIVAKLVNGTATAKCKVTVTDEDDYKYRLVLKDKGNSGYSINNPGDFLSAKAIARRRKMNIPIDETDLPISSDYIKAIQNVGGIIVAQSKWLKTVSVHCTDKFLIDKYKALPFVKDVVLVWEGKRSTSGTPAKYIDVPQAGAPQTVAAPLDYGSATGNITMNNGQALHNQGYKGAGIDIAVIDGGFIGLKANPMFNNISIKGAKSFVYENPDPYSIDSHGVWVTSCMAVNKPGNYVGTAPEANYWLFRTEDESSEFPIEEDYWVNAIEYADSVGVDIVNSSLYYTNGYYIPSARYTFNNMDGQTALATRAANMAFNKGIFIVCCAGNEQQWVGTPADSPDVLTVGSVTSRSIIDNFTSWGITVDGRMKPDVVALGGGAWVVNTSGTTEQRSGTSYSSPIVCGLVACLWQAYPQLSNKNLLDIMRHSADRYNNPIVPYGYGIPNMQLAITYAQ